MVLLSLYFINCVPDHCTNIIIGQPVAWAICDTETKDTYTEFFKAIKRRVPEATISVLMTDDGKKEFVFWHCYRFRKPC